MLPVTAFPCFSMLFRLTINPRNRFGGCLDVYLVNLRVTFRNNIIAPEAVYGPPLAAKVRLVMPAANI